jgi:hypothetical protein
MTTRTKKEITLAGILLGFGAGVLPALVYFVGARVVGEYEGENGLATFYGALFDGIGALQFAPWLLVLSPYLAIQLLRLGVALRRPRRDVKRVTN